MKKLGLKIKPLSISVLIGIGLIIFNEPEKIATASKLQQLTHKSVAKNNDRQKIARENFNQNNNIEHKNNAIKSSSQQLVGGWNTFLFNEAGEKIQNTIFFDSDGTWYFIVSTSNGTWYIHDRGTWQLSNGILYKTSESEKNLKGSVNFLSNNEFSYRSDKGTTKWQRINSQKNRSAEQLLGTWEVTTMQRISGHLTRNVSEIATLKLMELNPDGTFRYKSTDARFAAWGIKIFRRAGTWEYINSGYADGFLILKDFQGQVLSVSSITWSEKGGFLNINRSEIDKNKNQLIGGKIEFFNLTSLRID